MVKPVGCRDTNLETLRFRYLEGLEDGQIAAEVTGVTDIRPDYLTLLSGGGCCRRKRRLKAVGVKFLTLVDLVEMPRVASEDGRRGVGILAGTEIGRRANRTRCQSTRHCEDLIILALARVQGLEFVGCDRDRVVGRIHGWAIRLVGGTVFIGGGHGDRDRNK